MHNITGRIIKADADAVAEEALKLLLEQAELAIAARGRFVLGLAGGSTPEVLYQRLGDAKIDYSQWMLVYGDERHAPAGSELRNATAVHQYWLDKVNFPASHHYALADTDTVEQAAEQYWQAIEPLIPMDVCLLGMGWDGHTASLFPGVETGEAPVIAVHNSPKPPPERVTLNYSLLNRSRVLCFLITGESKQQALARWYAGEDLPVSRLRGQEETLLLIDEAAAKDIDP